MAQEAGGGVVRNVMPEIESFNPLAVSTLAGRFERLFGSVYDDNGEQDIQVLRVTLKKPWTTKERVWEADLGDVPGDRPEFQGETGWRVWNPEALDGRLEFEFDYMYPKQGVGTYTWTLEVQDAQGGESRSVTVQANRDLKSVVRLEVRDEVGNTIPGGSLSMFADDAGPAPFTVVAFDAEGDERPVDSVKDVVWSVSSGGGVFDENRLEPTRKAGTYFVNAAFREDLNVTASSLELVVQPGMVSHVTVFPKDIQVSYPGRYTFQASAFDAFGNRVPEARFNWSISDPSLGEMDSLQGTFLPVAPGVAEVTASLATPIASSMAVPPQDSASVETVADVDAVERLQFELEDPDVPVTVRSGDRLAAQLVAVGRDGVPLGGLPIHWDVADPRIGIVDGEGVFRAFRAGSTQIIASLADLEARLDVIVVPGPIAQVRIVPPSAAVTQNGTLRLTAIPMDGFGNVIPEVSFRWHTNNTLGRFPVESDGFFEAGPERGEVRVTASSFRFHREAVVYIIAPEVVQGEVNRQQAARLKASLGDVVTDSQVVGFSKAAKGSRIQVETDLTDSDVRGAEIRLGSDASNVAIIIETQRGSMEVVPDAVDVSDLIQVLLEFDVEEPGLYLTVLATEDGQVVSPGRLQELIENLDVTFRVDAGYFLSRGLDPLRSVMVKYSQGERSQDRVDVEFVDRDPDDLHYLFTTSFHRFSSFALVAPASPGGPVGSGGGGGGGAGGGGGGLPGPMDDSTRGGGCLEHSLRSVETDVDSVLRRMEAVFSSRVCHPPFPVEYEVWGPQSPPLGAPGLPGGVVSWRYLELEPGRYGAPQEMVFSLSVPADMAGDARRGVLLRLLDGEWRVAGVFPLYGEPGQARGAQVRAPCCGVYAFVADVEPPRLGLGGAPMVWIGDVMLDPGVTDNLGVEMVVLYVDGLERARSQEAPFFLGVPEGALPGGIYEVRVVALDIAGNRAEQQTQVRVGEFAVGGFDAQITENWVMLLVLIGVVAVWVARRTMRRLEGPAAPRSSPSGEPFRWRSARTRRR